ncbi:MAG: rhodanese-like domain-containing protein [Verrucomicrobiota bacterium]
MKTHTFLKLVILAFLPMTAAVAASADEGNSAGGWKTYVTASQVAELLEKPNTLAIDVRSADEYAAGHIPGAINLPGSRWRTPKAKPGKGESQYIFRDSDEKPDVQKYESFLSQAGVKNSHDIIVYGNHAGKTDGSVPAMILEWLGHENIAFLNGIGVDQWTGAGFNLTDQPRTLEPSSYVASPIPGYIWNLGQVLGSLDDPNVVFVDTRTEAEYVGENKRDNARGGHIPGAIRFDYVDGLDPDTMEVLPAEVIQAELDERGITRDQTIVLYCQTSTRVSLHALALKDLGYDNVVVYDASWFEYGNRDDTPISGIE